MLQEHRHHLAIGPRKDQRNQRPGIRADSSIGIDVLTNYLPGGFGPYSSWSPCTSDIAYPSESSFVLCKKHNRPIISRISGIQHLLYDFREFFLKSSWRWASLWTWTVLGTIFLHPCRLSIRYTVVLCTERPKRSSSSLLISAAVAILPVRAFSWKGFRNCASSCKDRYAL